MLKKSLLCLSTLCIMSSAVFASPLTDYSNGKTAIDVNLYPSLSFHLTNNVGYDKSPKGNSDNFDWGITTGLGNKFALQIRQFNPETKAIGDEIIKTKTQEFNVLYQIGDGISIFTGYHQSKIDDVMFGNTISSNTKNTVQFGLTGNTKIADKTHLFGTVGVGSGLTNYEIGLAYDVAKSMELNVLYRDKKVKNIKFPSVNVASEFKGFGYGLTYKF